MTIEEWAKDFKSYVNELQMPNDDYKGIMSYIDDALALLKEQQQIPVKDVQWHEVTRKRMINGICPTCNSIITHFNGSRFCDKCGQAVKWE